MENGFRIIVDRDKSLGYETKRWLYFLTLPLLWLLTIWVMVKKTTLGIFGVKPRINTFWVDRLSPLVRGVKEGAGSWRALDIIYNYQNNGSANWIDGYWFRMLNAQAVRNRLRLVKRELTNAIREVADRETEVRILSVASGSAQAVTETMAELIRENNIKLKSIFLDLDPTAIEYSRKMAKDYNLEERITFVRASTTHLENVVGKTKPNIIEMIGFLDYRPYTKAVALVEKIHNLLPPGGWFLTANICPNQERVFMKWVIDWFMIYRNPKDLRQILIKGGFEPGDVHVIYEPLRLHAVAICRKT